MISINTAVEREITKLRQPHWACPDDYLELHVSDGFLGPWAKLYSPLNEVIGQENPQRISTIGMDKETQEWEIYAEN